jgi:hypothetical protein
LCLFRLQKGFSVLALAAARSCSFRNRRHCSGPQSRGVDGRVNT